MNGYMQIALDEARKAYNLGEVPIGAVCVYNDKVISKGHNLIERKKDASGHAEMIVLKKASKKLKNWRLDGVELYVTVAPCIMCSGYILNSRVSKVIYGADNPNFSGINLLKDKIEIVSGVEVAEARELMQSFFEERRGNK